MRPLVFGWLTLAITVLGAPPGPAAEGEKQMGLVEISNGTITVGVLPSLGGRVVSLRPAAGENLLDSDPKYWDAPYPKPALETPFAPWNGRIVWVGPQTGFWSQQELRPGLVAGWPPDPFNETGRFEVAKRTPTRLQLKGEVSPVTGLAFEHEYEITGERTVRMKVTATNGRRKPVSWDLWPNTRVRPAGTAYVPLGAEPPRVDGGQDAETGTYPHHVESGWVSIAPGARPTPPRQKLWVKLYLRPDRGLIAYFYGRYLLLIRATVVPKERLHPEQAFVELYRGAGPDPADDILELEMHGPYLKLEPGASMSFEQTFEVQDGVGPDATPAEHLARLAALPR